MRTAMGMTPSTSTVNACGGPVAAATVAHMSNAGLVSAEHA